jgi:hypothetical protein
MEAVEAFDSTIQRARALIKAHAKLRGPGPGKRPRFHSDLLRAALVTAVSAMDAYFHDKIVRNVSSTIKKTKPNFPPELVSLLAGRQKANEVVGVLLQISMKARPLAHISTRVARGLSERTFQDPGRIEQGLKIIRVQDFWTSVSNALDVPPNELKREMMQYVKRRHSIVHAGDLGTSKKMRHQVRQISRTFAETCIESIERFVHASDAVIDSQI